MKQFIIIFAIILSGCITNTPKPEPTIITEIVNDTVYISDTVALSPKYVYNKVEYSIKADTGACMIYWITGDNYKSESMNFKNCGNISMSYIIKDSKSLNEYISLQISGDDNQAIKSKQTIIGMITINDSIRLIDSLNTNDEYLKIEYRFNY